MADQQKSDEEFFAERGFGMRIGFGEKPAVIVIDVINADDRLLIVDDVFDTGHTMVAIVEQIKSRARRNAPECRVATVYYKPEKNETDIEPNYYTVADNRWIIFPHELDGLTEDELREHRAALYEAALSD